jgi:hypothetical protein
MKKQPEDHTAAVPAIAPSVVEDKASVEGNNSLAIIASAPKEAIGTAPEIIGTSRDIGSSGVNQEKKDPPLT